MTKQELINLLKQKNVALIGKEDDIEIAETITIDRLLEILNEVQNY